MALILKQYKLPAGGVNFQMIFNIPSAERIPALFKQDYLRTTALVGMAVSMSFDRMRFKKKPDGVLVNNLVEEIIDSADEDNLSMEDLLLFLQSLVRGKYGNFEDVSIPRFMNLFSTYRDERFEEGVRNRDSKIAQWQGLGDANRSYKEDPLSEHMSNLSGRISEMKDRLKEQKEIQTIKKAENYYGNK